MKVLGIGFAGTSPSRRDAMTDFMSSVLGLTRTTVGGVEADVFLLPDGSVFAVSSPSGMGETDRSVGFLVDDLDAALAELRAAGIDVDESPASNALFRYAHFVAPDGHLYEVLERVSAIP
jgi:catechol 2,3-dioxygenase-like lactoylglutathione lyase family enzyme